MPKQLKEIRNFNLGTVLNMSEKDIPEDAAAYSLNINPLSENGILNAINSDKLFCVSTDEFSTSTPISWSYTGESEQGTFNNVHRITFDDLSIFEDKQSTIISFIGTKGVKENLYVSQIQPWYEKLVIGEETDNIDVEFIPSAKIEKTDDYISILSGTNTITDSTITNWAVTGFTDGEATITISGAIATDETFVITTPDGLTKTYEFDVDGTPATGALKGSNTCVQIQNLTGSNDDMAEQIKAAIENDTYGHGNRIEITQVANVLTLTYRLKTLTTYFVEGDYFSLNTSSYSSNEIMKVESIDIDNNKIYIKRALFGTTIEEYAASSVFKIYSNRTTFDTYNQSRTQRAICKISGWSDYSGNHIGGNSHYLLREADAANRATSGFADVSVSNYEIVFDATNKTITFGTAVTSLNFYEGDHITFFSSIAYHVGNGTSLNSGYTGKILKKAVVDSKIVLTMDTAPTDHTMDGSPDSGDVWYEAGLIKNHSFVTNVTTSIQTVGSAVEYKTPFWAHKAYKKDGSGRGEGNVYIYDSNTDDKVVFEDESPFHYWATSPGNIDLGGTTNNSANFYPFLGQTVKDYIKIAYQFVEIGDGVATLTTNALIADANDVTIYANKQLNDKVAAGDILRLSASDTIAIEKMKVLSVHGTYLIVERAILGTTLTTHASGRTMYRSANHSISQSIDKTRLKPGQQYRFSFWARGGGTGGDVEPAISIRYNGGYIQEDGNWTKGSDDPSMGVAYDDNSKIMQEHRWISFKDLDKPFGDVAEDSDGNPTFSTLDDSWRNFSIVIKSIQGVEFDTNMEIEISNRAGNGATNVRIDRLELIENTIIYNNTGSSLLKTTALLDNSGKKDLVSYDSVLKQIKVLPKVFKDKDFATGFTSNVSLSSTATSNIKTSLEDAALTPNNREVHIGLGGHSEDTSPQWLGYVNHTVFGKDYSDELYQDEDTVHTYDEEGSGNMSKVCLAGEHEKITVSWSSPNLTVTHVAHSMNIGDNIVIREWMDANNSWDGNGVWIVKTAATDSFTCVRGTTYDKDPSGGPSNNLICYRPYFYYGIKDGESNIYRIWPDAKLGGGGSGDDSLNTLSTTYTKGKIEKSIMITTGATSIATCYNKDITESGGGTGGGCVYILSSISDEIHVYNVEKAYNAWTDTSLTRVSTIDLAFKSFKWSNDNINGNIGGDTEVFGGLASESSPTIKYSGILSDIIETKGTTHLFDADATANSSINLNMFDTRLWIQCVTMGEEGFSEGDRFLFAGRTENDNTTGPSVLYCADRTPPTTVLDHQRIRYSRHGNKFEAGPGDKPSNSPRAYFHWRFGHKDSKSKLSRLATCRGPAEDHDGNSGFFDIHSRGEKGQINFGFNTGWKETPNIKIAKFSLFQLSDNDGDGIIDGTGLVVANTTTIDNTDDWTGPWGRLHQRVCSHVVGILGGVEGNWQRHWGRVQGAREMSGKDFFVSNYGDGPNEDAPEYMNVEKCIFISSDTHYGDNQPVQKYTFKTIASVGSGEQTTLAVETDITTDGVKGLEVGDAIFIGGIRGKEGNPHQATTISNIDRGENTIVVPIAFADFDEIAESDDRDMSDDTGFWTDSANCTYNATDDDWDVNISSGGANEEVLKRNNLLEASTKYIVKFTISSRSSGTVKVTLGSQDGASTYSADGTHTTEAITANGSTFAIRTTTAAAVFTIDNISIIRASKIGTPTGDDSTAIWDAYPHAIHRVWAKGRSHQNIGGVHDREKMFHYAFDKNEPKDGTVFRQGKNGDSKAAGHYTRTYFTSPSYWGGSKTSNHVRIAPGFVWPLEKLSFRAGVMIRPFVMDDDDFKDLMGGHGTSISMPSWPNPVYHVANSSYLHYDKGNSSPNNAYASKLFIASPMRFSTNNEAKIYICDLNFMYPSKSIQVQAETTSGGNDTNGWNDGVSWDVCFTGTIVSYNLVNAATDLNGDNSTHPMVRLEIPTTVGPNTDVFNAGSRYRDLTNSLYGLCLSVMDATTGTIQTRYIVGSIKRGDTTGEDMYVKVHFPFGHPPAASDKFWVWKHSLVATAPVRLMKTTTNFPDNNYITQALHGDPILEGGMYANTGTITDLDLATNVATATCGTTVATAHGLSINDFIRIKDSSDTDYNGVHKIVSIVTPNKFTFALTKGDTTDATATWELIEDSDSSVANPLTTTLTRPIINSNFGGLDMRKSRALNVVSAINDNHETVSDEVRAELTFTSDVFKTGEIVTLKNAASDTVFNGTYRLAKGSEATTGTGVATTADIPHNSTAGNVTDDYNLTTNQWELFIAGTGGKSEMGELRAGFTQWDKGNIASNIQRYDSTDDADRFMAFGESSFTIRPVSLADQEGDFFTKNNTYYYKVSYMYDGYQEGPLSASFWTHRDSVTRSKLSIQISVKNFSRRLSHVSIYRKDNINDFYKLVKEIPTKDGWNSDGKGGYSYIIGDEGDLGATYEARTGLSEVIDTIKIKYGIAAECNGYLFVGDCSHSKIDNASNLVFRSKPGMFSVFDYAVDFLTLKSKPTALASFNGRIYAFDDKNIYRINPENLATEDIYEGVGCIDKNSVIVTDYGMFFADKNGAYMHDGVSPNKISTTIQKGGDTEVAFGGTDNIRDLSWENAVTNNNSVKPYVIYDGATNCVLFNVSIKTPSTKNSITRAKLEHYVWAFSIISKRWDLWELANNVEIGKPFIGERGQVYYPIGNGIYEHRGGSTKRDYTWISKKLSMNEDSIVKVFNKVKMNGLTQDVNLGGDYIESSDRLLITTSLGDVSSSDITSSIKDNGFIDYKIKGSNKKGRWVQIKAENMTEPIDSIGFIFRRKGTK